MMLVYHLLFDLWYLGLADVDIRSLPLVLFQRSIGLSFVLLAGISITLSESRNASGYARHARRAAILGAVAIGITAATWIYPHKGFITFGIIHFMALAALVGPLFLRLGRWNVLAGLLIIAAGLAANAAHVDTPYLFWLGLTDADYRALDFYPFLPWFGVTLLGIAAGQQFFPNGAGRWRAAPSGIAGKALEFMGRNALTIYIAHQPLWVAGLLAWKGLFGAG